MHPYLAALGDDMNTRLRRTVPNRPVDRGVEIPLRLRPLGLGLGLGLGFGLDQDALITGIIDRPFEIYIQQRHRSPFRYGYYSLTRFSEYVIGQGACQATVWTALAGAEPADSIANGGAMSDTTEPPLAIEVPEYAKAADVSKSAVYEAIARGELPAIRIGRAVRLPRWLLNKLIDPEAK